MGATQSIDYDEKIVFINEDCICELQLKNKKFRDIASHVLYRQYRPQNTFLKYLGNNRTMVLEQEYHTHMRPIACIDMRIYTGNKMTDLKGERIDDSYNNYPDISNMIIKDNCIYTYGMNPYFIKIETNPIDKIEISKMTISHQYPLTYNITNEYNNIIPKTSEEYVRCPFVIQYSSIRILPTQEGFYILIKKNLQFYQSKGSIQEIYYDKYNKNIYLLIKLDNFYHLQICEIVEDKLVFSKRLILHTINFNDIIYRIVFTHQHFIIMYIHFINYDSQYRIEVYNKYNETRLISFLGTHADYCDEYDKWFNEKLDFLQKITVLKRFSIDLLKIILLYVN